MKIIVTGAAGRMGREVCALAGEELVCGVDPNGAVGDISDYDGPADGIIDFSFHAAIPAIAGYAVTHGLPLVVATTGHTPEELTAIRTAARSVPVFFSANMSIGIAVLCELAKETVKAFPDADVEIVETHHNRKLDAPSGTALMLAKSIAQVRKQSTFVYGRVGHAKRDPSEIGIHALRMGNVVGEHEIIIGTDTQRITLKHEAFTRTVFAEGALAALRFLEGKAAGLYEMRDMIE